MYEFNITDNAISNIYVNSEYVKKYTIYLGHTEVFKEDLNFSGNFITQENFQIIPATLYHKLSIKFEFYDKQLMYCCKIFSYDVLKYNYCYNIREYHNKIPHAFNQNHKNAINIVLKNYTLDFPIKMPDFFPCVAILDTFENLTHFYDFKRYLKIDIHHLPNISAVFIKGTKNEEHALKLVNNIWSYKFSEISFVVDYIFIELDKYSEDKFVKCDFTCCNRLNNSCDMGGLQICWGD